MNEGEQARASDNSRPTTDMKARRRPAAPGSWLWVVTAGAAVLILSTILLASFWFMRRPLAILFLGATVAAALAPVVTWLERWVSRTLATTIVYLVLALVLVGLGAAVVPPLVDQAGELIDRAPALVDQAGEWLGERIPISGESVVDTLLSQITGVASTIVSLPFQVSSSLADILLVVFLSFYTLTVAPEMRESLLSLVPQEERDDAERLFHRLPHAMGGYVRGATISGLIIGTLGYIGLLIIGVSFALVLGIIAGVLEFIPFVGPLISGALIVIVAFVQSPGKALIALGFVIVLEQVEGNVVAPNVMHPQTNISPVMTLFAVFAGWSIGGALGAIVAIPLAAALRVLVVELLVPAVRRQTGALEGDEVTNTKSE
ncbi:MAG: AI-2E family transporter [Anaerolineae bacterium]